MWGDGELTSVVSGPFSVRLGDAEEEGKKEIQPGDCFVTNRSEQIDD